jgi:hypothetical protein
VEAEQRRPTPSPWPSPSDQQYPRLSRIRLHWLWTGLHLGVAAYGLVLIILTLVVS